MSVASWVEQAAAEHRAGRPLALFFDYDGTLTPIVAHPVLADLSAATRAALHALARTDRVRVAVVSSRGLRPLTDHVGLPGLWYAGSGGMHLDLGGEEWTDPTMAAFEEVADAIVVATAQPIRWYPGAWVERKPGCLTIHYRELAPLKAACLVEEIQATLAELQVDGPPLRIREVALALEVSQAASWTKGTAVERMLGRLPANTFALYAGDGANDAEGIGAVNARNGFTIGVGPEAPRTAGVRRATPEEFARDLADLAAALNTPRPAGPVWTLDPIATPLSGDALPAR